MSVMSELAIAKLVKDIKMFKLMIVLLLVCNSIFVSIPMSEQTPPSLKTNLGAYIDKIVQLPMMNIKGNCSV